MLSSFGISMPSDEKHGLPEECKAGNHKLVEIYKNGSEMEETVVRWCSDCGSITVDIDYDGRTNPGAIMKMRSPKISKI